MMLSNSIYYSSKSYSVDMYIFIMCASIYIYLNLLPCLGAVPAPFSMPFMTFPQSSLFQTEKSH